tara:strand:+ start:814 stop:1014 length:201 start_codon:yes stop_codon:yes gene_type:complete
MSDENIDQTQQDFELPIFKSQECESTEIAPQVTLDMFNELQLEVMQLHAEFAKLRRQFEEQKNSDS